MMIRNNWICYKLSPFLETVGECISSFHNTINVAWCTPSTENFHSFMLDRARHQVMVFFLLSLWGLCSSIILSLHDRGTWLIYFPGQKHRVSIPQEKTCDKIPDCRSCAEIQNCKSPGANRCDECNCSSSTHFYCSSGKPLFVERTKVEDGKNDCSDGSDECPPSFLSNNPLSSKDELRKSVPLQISVWIMAFVSIVGNVAVFVTTSKTIYESVTRSLHQTSNTPLINALLVLNLSLADFLMGIVLLMIAIKSAQFSGSYCKFDKTWRTSGTCNFIGILTVSSSEASVLALVCITAQRLYSVHRPIQARNSSVKLITGGLVLVWVFSLFLALVPFLPSLSSYMVTKALVSKSAYFHSDLTDYSEFSDFANRLSGLSSGTKLTSVGWQNVNKYLELNFAAIKPNITGYFGYYSVSGVCLPKFYRTADDVSHFNIMSAAIICFNFFALIFIAASYASIYLKSTSSVPTQASGRARKMQRKITILIFVDVACWLPICIMSFLSMGSIVIPSILYAVSAIILLPINSSLNPVIYTDVIQKIGSFLLHAFASARSGKNPG